MAPEAQREEYAVAVEIAGDRAPRAWLVHVLVLAATVQLLAVNYWPAFPSPNERGRAYQALAVVTRGSLAIDDEVARFGGMEDMASAGGRLYPNKAPGALPLVVPAAAAARLLAPDSPQRELALTLYLGRLAAASLPHLLTAVLLAAWLRRDGEGAGRAAVAAYALASPALAASLLLFSHALAACLLLAGFVLLRARARPGALQAALAGLALSWAAVSEYPVAVPAAVLVALAIPRLRLAGTLTLALGGALPALGLAAYNAACFGSPLALSSGHEADATFATVAAHGVFGVGVPSIGAAAGLLFSPARGALVWMPWLAAALAAAGAPGGGRAERATLTLVPFSLLLLMSGYASWHGGWFAGPRYLLAVAPFVAILAGRGMARVCSTVAGRVLLAAAFLWSLAATWVSIAAFPFPPEDYPLPAATFALPLLVDGVLVPSWLPRELAAPLLALLAAAAAVLVLRLIPGRRTLAEPLFATLIAAVALAATLALPQPATWQARLEGAVVRDVYAGAPRGGALRELEAHCETPEQRAQLQRWLASAPQ